MQKVLPVRLIKGVNRMVASIWLKSMWLSLYKRAMLATLNTLQLIKGDQMQPVGLSIVVVSTDSYQYDYSPWDKDRL